MKKNWLASRRAPAGAHVHTVSFLAHPLTLIRRQHLHLPTRTLVTTVPSLPVFLPPGPENRALPIHTHTSVCAHIYTHLYYTHPAHIHCKYTSPHRITWCTHPLDTPGFRLCQALSRHPCKLCACALFSLGSHQCRTCTHMRATYMHVQFVHDLHTHKPTWTDTPPFGLHREPNKA